jgi:hypothetical protein
VGAEVNLTRMTEKDPLLAVALVAVIFLVVAYLILQLL